MIEVIVVGDDRVVIRVQKKVKFAGAQIAYLPV